MAMLLEGFDFKIAKLLFNSQIELSEKMRYWDT